jgi:hypothetical protein
MTDEHRVAMNTVLLNLRSMCRVNQHTSYSTHWMHAHSQVTHLRPAGPTGRPACAEYPNAMCSETSHVPHIPNALLAAKSRTCVQQPPLAGQQCHLQQPLQRRLAAPRRNILQRRLALLLRLCC